MRRVQSSEILDLESYERARSETRERLWAVKAARRVHLGPHLTFLFENPETVRYQVQEMLRVERRGSEADVAHELETYNELLGGQGEFGCTLLIEIEDERERDVLLARWLRLPHHLFAILEDGSRIAASFDERQMGETRLSSVQYLRFPCGEVPLGLGSDLPGHEVEVTLSSDQRAALAEDLADA